MKHFFTTIAYLSPLIASSSFTIDKLFHQQKESEIEQYLKKKSFDALKKNH